MKSPNHAMRSIVMASAVAAGFSTFAPPTRAQSTTSPVQLVEALNGVFGSHAGARASHAKGVCARGEFAGDAAAALTRASFLRGGGKVDVTARFSVGGGNPKASDKSRSVRGLALRFHGADKTNTDLVMISAPVFFVNSPENFVKFLEARRPNPATGAADPDRVRAFQEAHPDARPQAAFLAAHNPPASYGTTPYWGANAFRFTNAAGQSVHARWRFEPVAGTMRLDADQLKSFADGFLVPELTERLKSGPVQFDAFLQVAAPGDSVIDPTVEWPSDRRQVRAGRLSITQLADQACDRELFNPLSLAEGIAASGDPTLVARPGSYAVSLGRRTQ